MKVIATNKKAYFDYFVIKSYLCGIKLAGSEVKSIRKGDCNLKDSFVIIDRKGEVYVKNMYIKPYEKSTSYACDPRASRKLLLHRSEIDKLKRGSIQTIEYSKPIPEYIESDVIFSRPDVMAVEKQLEKAKIQPWDYTSPGTFKFIYYI